MEVDRNRRGLVVLFETQGNYTNVLTNTGCFSSDNEDGGLYFAPELYIFIEKGNLYVHYSHGRYGFWKYTFRYQNEDLELIGFDTIDSFGPITESETSYNFSTKRKLTRTNVGEREEMAEEVFEEKWEDINVDHLIRLSKVEDFDELRIKG